MRERIRILEMKNRKTAPTMRPYDDDIAELEEQIVQVKRECCQGQTFACFTSVSIATQGNNMQDPIVIVEPHHSPVMLHKLSLRFILN